MRPFAPAVEARFPFINLTQTKMNKEHPSSENREGVEYEVTEEERSRFNHAELRLAAKDLRIVIGQTRDDFPNREKLFKIADEILTLVPVYAQEDEDRDERRREQLREEIRAAAIQWEIPRKSRE